jgi:hypothetical protein
MYTEHWGNMFLQNTDIELSYISAVAAVTTAASRNPAGPAARTGTHGALQLD